MAAIATRTDPAFIAGAKAMTIESLKEQLRNRIAHFLYLKKNGEIRKATGTTNDTVAAKYTYDNGCGRELFKTAACFDIGCGE